MYVMCVKENSRLEKEVKELERKIKQLEVELARKS
jgi:hypothetical protein